MKLLSAADFSEKYPQPGIYAGIPFRSYHRAPGASPSRLRPLIRQTPAHCKELLDHPKEATPLMAFGTAAHLSVLEPDQFCQEYVVADRCEAKKKGDGTPCTNDAKGQFGGRWLCGVHGKGEPDADGRLPLSQEQFDRMLYIREEVYSGTSDDPLRPTAADLLRDSMREVSIFWIDPATGILCKGRIDILSRYAGLYWVADLKTTADAGMVAFTNSIIDNGYAMQGAAYLFGLACNGVKAERFCLIPIERDAPFGVAVYQLDFNDLAKGFSVYSACLSIFAKCSKSGVYPGYDKTLTPLKLPERAWRNLLRG